MKLERGDIRYQEVMKNYHKDKNDLQKTVDDFRHIVLPLYKKEYPLRYVSYYRLVKFLKLLQRYSLVPDINDFVEISINNELFDADVFFMFFTRKQPVMIKIPFVINITKLNAYLESRATAISTFKTRELEQIIYPECIDEYELDLLVKDLGGDLLEEIKAKNALIVMKAGKANDPFLINGTHRTIGAIKNGEEEVKGYYVDPKLCSRFALSPKFEKVYIELLRLYKKVYLGKEIKPY